MAQSRVEEGPTKHLVIKVRVDPLQRRDLEYAAQKNGLELSTWMRQLALREADRIKRGGGLRRPA